MKRFAALVLILGPCLAAGQGLGGNVGGMPAQNPSSGVAGQFFSGDFVNYNLFFDGIWDSGNQYVSQNGVGAGGFSLGGGASLGKTFADGGSLGLTYRGDFRDYPGSPQGAGTDQYLSMTYARHLGRHWSISFVEGAGMLFYMNPFYGSANQPGGGPLTNPYSPSSRYLQSSVYLSYQQTARLSYVFGGSFVLNRYSFNGAVGTTGFIGTASVVYALSRRTTVGATYSHDYYHYQGGFGQSTIDGGYLNLNHTVARTWQLFASGGATYVQTNGFYRFLEPIYVPGIGFVEGAHYSTTSTVPTFEGGVRHQAGKFNLTASAGHGVNPGNGTFLTSSHTFFTGGVSRPFGRQAVITANGSFSSLKSIASKQLIDSPGTPSYFNFGYQQLFFNVSYSRVITRHVSGFLTYNYSRYGSIGQYRAAGDNRIIVGISYSSKPIPFTLF